MTTINPMDQAVTTKICSCERWNIISNLKNMNKLVKNPEIVQNISITMKLIFPGNGMNSCITKVVQPTWDLNILYMYPPFRTQLRQFSCLEVIKIWTGLDSEASSRKYHKLIPKTCIGLDSKGPAPMNEKIKKQLINNGIVKRLMRTSNW